MGGATQEPEGPGEHEVREKSQRSQRLQGGEQDGDGNGRRTSRRGNTSCTYGNMKDAYHSQSLQLGRNQLHGYRTRVLI